MKIFKVIKSCRISFRDESTGDPDQLPLNTGDLIFIKQVGWYSGSRESCEMLTDIYYFNEENSDEYDFIHLKDINIISPVIHSIGGSYAMGLLKFYEYLENITESWERNEKINSIIG